MTESKVTEYLWGNTEVRKLWLADIQTKIINLNYNSFNNLKKKHKNRNMGRSTPKVST